jgi:hypothetical protein
MNTSDRFLRFAAECEVMAKFSRTQENRAVWNGLAERWVRCAKLMDHKDSEYYSRRSLKRRPRAIYSSAH